MSEKKEGIRLSYSAISTFNLCSEKYRLERILKLQPKTLATPLWFGKACDAASDVIFRAKMRNKQTGEFDTKFDRNEMLNKLKSEMTMIDYQGEIIDIRSSLLAKYSKADVQPELLQAEDKELINQFLIEKELEVDSIEDYIEYFKDKKERVPEEVEVYNYMAWLCLYRKAEMLLDRLKQWADEKIIEVISIQNYFKIKNADGDQLSGLSDLEAILVDSPDEVSTIDLKTATGAVKQYPDGCVEDSMQLRIYSEETGNKRCGYVVLDKAIGKREPRVKLREVYGEITEEMKDEVFDLIDETLQNIKAEKFTKNKDACFAFSRCQFFDLCHYGKMDGLVERVYAEKKVVDSVEEKK